MRPHDAPAVTAERERWASAVRPLLVDPTEMLWRAHSDAVNAAFLAARLPEEPGTALLKTDLWDEAMGEGLYSLLATHARQVVGVDLVPAVVAAAAARYPNLVTITGDVRALPFADTAFDLVVSNSTLDHFAARADIAVALGELWRVLRPGGTLLLTLDNMANPVVALRNILPFALLRRLGIVAYPIGCTYGPRGLRRALRTAGFEVQDTAALLHCPRLLAIVVARHLHRAGAPESRARYLARLARWEALARWPTRFLTGYYIAISARKASG